MARAAPYPHERTRWTEPARRAHSSVAHPGAARSCAAAGLRAGRSVAVHRGPSAARPSRAWLRAVRRIRGRRPASRASHPDRQSPKRHRPDPLGPAIPPAAALHGRRGAVRTAVRRVVHAPTRGVPRGPAGAPARRLAHGPGGPAPRGGGGDVPGGRRAPGCDASLRGRRRLSRRSDKSARSACDHHGCRRRAARSLVARTTGGLVAAPGGASDGRAAVVPPGDVAAGLPRCRAAAPGDRRRQGGREPLRARRRAPGHVAAAATTTPAARWPSGRLRRPRRASRA